MSSAHQYSSYMLAIAYFSRDSLQFRPASVLQILSMGTPESLVYSSLIEHEGTLYLLTLAPCQTFITAPDL